MGPRHAFLAQTSSISDPNRTLIAICAKVSSADEDETAFAVLAVVAVDAC